MPDTDALRALATAGDDNVQVAYVILIDGILYGFTDHRGLVGASTGGGHSIVQGLSREGMMYRLAIDLKSNGSGQILDSPLSFTLRNVDGTLDLADLFKAIDDTERALDDVPVGAGLPIHPSTSVVGRTDLYDTYVGLERIGSGGGRHQYPVPPDYEIGLEHRLRSAQNNLEAAPVSDDPIVWNGRRVVLYRVYRDHITYPGQPTQGWRPFAEWVRIWWGTMRDDGVVAGHEWQIEADGPESLLRKPLGIEYQREPVAAVAQFELTALESTILLRIDAPGAFGGNDDFGDTSYTITGTTPETIRADVQAALDDLAGTTGGTDGIYNDQVGCSASMDDQGVIRIAIQATQTGPGRVTWAMHAKVWAILGYVPDWQNALVPSFDDTRAAQFFPQGHPWFSQFTAGLPEDAEDYVIGYFYTGDPLDPSPTSDTDPLGLTNEGNPRNFRPWYLSGTQVLFADPGQKDTRAGQLVRIGDAALGVDSSQSTVAHPGQLDRPPASSVDDPQAAATIDGTPVDRQGLWLFFGKRRLSDANGAGTVVDEYQVARASWVNAGGQQDGLVNGDQILITEWLEPGDYGFNRPKLGNDSLSENDHQWAGDWVSRVDAINPDEGLLFCVPIISLGYINGGTDRADVVLQRLLLSTGTSTGWNGYAADDTVEQTAGQNEPATTSDLAVLDAELATLGLGVPSDWVQSVAQWNAAVDLVDTQQILEQKVAFSGGYQSMDVIRGLMQSIGWAWNLRGGQYGVWCPADPIGLADAEFVLVKAAKPNEQGTDTRQQQRKSQPIDRFTFDASWAPHLNKTAQKIELQSPDPGYAYRPGDVSVNVPAHSYRGGGGLSDRVAHLSRFWARRHFEVKGYRVPQIPFEDCWPGTIVRVTDDRMVDPRGTVGVTNRLAIVTAVNVTIGVDDGTTTLDLLVLGDRTITPRLNAPVAVGYRWDAATSTAYVHDNYFGFEDDDWSDAAAFVEPSHTGITPFGGAAAVGGYQWDGDTWALRITGRIASVVTTAGSASLTLSGTSGTAYRDMDTLWVLESKATLDNGAWVEALFAPICDDDGTFTTSAGSSAGYPWEA